MKLAKFQKLHIYSFYPMGPKLSLFSLYRQRFLRYGPSFKIAIFGYKTLPKFQKLHIYPLSTSWSNLFSLYGQRFLRYRLIFKIAILRHETRPLAKVPEVAHIHSYYPKRSKWNLFSVYGQQFPEKRADFCHIWAWNLAIGQNCRSCIFTLFLHQGAEIDFSFTLRAAFSGSCIYTLFLSAQGSKLSLFLLNFCSFWDTGGFLNLPYLSMKLTHWPKFQKLKIYSFSVPWGRNWAYFCSTSRGFWDTDRFSKLPYLGMKLGHWPKSQKLHIYSLSAPRDRNWAYFRSTGSGFWDMGDVQNCLIWAWYLALGKSPRSSTYIPSLSQGVEIELSFALRAVVPEIRASFQNCHIWPLAKVPDNAHILDFHPRGSKLSLFSMHMPWLSR